MKIAEFISQLKNLATSSAMGDIKLDVCEKGLREIRRTFDTETDPYGNIWPPTKEHEGHRHTLVDTGDLENSWGAKPTATGVSFASPLPYAAAQQYGMTTKNGGRIVGRKMVPVASMGLGDAWTRMIGKCVMDRLRKGIAK